MRQYSLGETPSRATAVPGIYRGTSHERKLSRVLNYNVLVSLTYSPAVAEILLKPGYLVCAPQGYAYIEPT